MSWKPIAQLPPEGTVVLVSDGTSIGMAQFVQGPGGMEFVIIPGRSPIKCWMTEAEAKTLLGPMP